MFLLLFLTAVLMLIGSYHEVRSATDGLEHSYQNPSEGILQLSVHNDMLTLNLRDASLQHVLARIANEANLHLSLPDDRSSLQKRVTLQFANIPIERGVKKLLRGENIVFIYGIATNEGYTGSPSAHTRDMYRLKQIRIIGPEGIKDSSGSSFSGQAPLPPSRIAVSSKPTPMSMPSSSAREAKELLQEERQSESIRTREQAERALTGLIHGNMDALQDMVQALKRDNPQLSEQIDQFMESLEEARQQAEKEGYPFPALDRLGSMGPLMEQMMRGKMGAPPSAP